MNDRFKFRVWDKEKNIVRYEAEKGLGDYLSFPFICKSDKFIVEQCTGLKDKNGRLIYEGDVVKIDSSTININETKARVFWHEDEGSFQLLWMPKGNGSTALKRIKKLANHDVGDCRWWEIEVIGNIHENPEMPDGKK